MKAKFEHPKWSNLSLRNEKTGATEEDGLNVMTDNRVSAVCAGQLTYS